MSNRKLPEDQEVQRLYLGGESMSNIGRRFGASPTTVKRALERLETPLRDAKQRAHWTGKTLAEEHRRNIKAAFDGMVHPNFKDGTQSRRYRTEIKKEICERCKATERLVVHHRDMDHFNNQPDNLGVLCNRCHQSEHKKAYWAAYRAGKELPKATGRVGWKPAPRKTNRRVKMWQGKPKQQS